MKSIVSAIALGLIILFSVLFAIVGAGIMVYDVYSGGPNFTSGFYMFCLSLILFFVATISFIATKILSNTEIIAQSLAAFIESEIEQDQPPINPVHTIFNGMGMQMPGIQISRIDENGQIAPLSTGNEELDKHHQEIAKRHRELLSKAFGIEIGGDVQKTIDNMTIEELQAEEKKAIDTQDFEKAAVIRDLIEKKKSK